MATIAKGSITLVNVNDAYSVLFTPDSCAIKADFDGTNPDLTNAYTDITVVRGEEKHTFKLTLSSFSNSGITYQQIAVDAYTKRIRLTSIPSDVLSGALTFTITTDDEFVADVTFTYSVIRETSMLDWILDWESNKTVIGDTYLITPKIFVGKKVENEEGLKTLTGVYIGPDDTNTAGIYGYKEGEDVFHINANGAMIGGWNVNKSGISTSNEYGTLYINSEGSISFYNKEGDKIWMLGSQGDAIFAQGNVSFNNNGDAYFDGEIQAASGKIGGWDIGESVLSSTNITLDSDRNCIAVYNTGVSASDDIKDRVKANGGVYMYYDSNDAYGIVGYGAMTRVGGLYVRTIGFSVGSTNFIGGWTFDSQALWRGTKINTTKTYTETAGDITIGTNGLRGTSWYIDSDGTASFASGDVLFSGEESSIVGWYLNDRRLSNSNVAIVADTENSGIFMSVADGTDFNTMASSSLTDYIDANGGIYMKIKADGVSFAAYNNDGKKIFKLRSNGVSSIAEWNIENDALFVGEKQLTAGSFTDAAGSMTFGNTGIRGYKWRLESDGSGAIAGGNIQWNENGEVKFSDSVSLNWTNGIDKANTAADIAQKMAFGKMLYRDPEFSGSDFNSAKLYPHNATAGSLEIVEDTTAPNGTQRVMKITSSDGWASSTDCRVVGFYFANQSRAGASFVVRIVAKIPTYLRICNYHNDYGDGGTTQWLTSQAGTGEYTEYLCLVTCGKSGTFSTINHFALTTLLDIVEPTSNTTWYVAYATVYDISSSDKLTTTIDINGIYTGTLRADQIVAGTIDSSLINADELLSNGNAWALKQDGSGYLANGNISWSSDGNAVFEGEIKANKGQIGSIEIYDDHIGVAASATDEGDAAWAALSIYKNFFKVGGSKGYAMFGNDVIPATAGEAFTAVGRIVNQAPNKSGSYGFDQANYGLFIDVTGGTKNYGISSNAALMAPAFVNTKAKILTFDPNASSYSIDFSQANVILMYYQKANSSGVEVELPSESSVAYKFGLSTLPEDFATIVTFRVREGSLPIMLKGIYNHNEELTNYTLVQGDSIVVLISKVDGFRYQIINHSC